MSSVGVGPCGSQNLPLGQVQRGALPVYGGGQEARTLPGGSALQEAERVGLSLLGVAGGVTDKWTSGGGSMPALFGWFKPSSLEYGLV